MIDIKFKSTPFAILNNNFLYYLIELNSMLITMRV
jgi:hypothetical protein